MEPEVIWPILSQRFQTGGYEGKDSIVRIVLGKEPVVGDRVIGSDSGGHSPSLVQAKVGNRTGCFSVLARY